MPARDDVRQDAQRKDALDALEAAAQFFEAQLYDGPGATARAWLDGRAMSITSRDDFRLGYAPREKFALRDHLAGKGVSREVMIEAGLLVHGEGVAVPYDRFRNRVMFPICDRGGRVISFGGRALDAAATAKYLNGPQTRLFDKGATLFNLHGARRAVHASGRAVVVEGYVDVIAMVAAGFAETVAPLGTALTDEHLVALWGLCEEPVICFDGDSAGAKAMGRAIDVALPRLSAKRTLRFVSLPAGYDPDDLIRAQGPTAMVAALGRSRPLVEALWLRERDRGSLDTPERRAGLLDRLGAIAGQIGDVTLRRAYLDDLRGRAFQHFRDLRGTAGRRRPGVGFLTSAPAISDSLAASRLFAGMRR